jgi:hypothetical protein
MNKLILGTLAKLRKVTISFVMFVCLSVRPSVRPFVRVEQLSRIGWIFMKFDT